MDYAFCRIDDAANYIRSELARIEEDKKNYNLDDYEPSKYDRSWHPDKTYFASAEALQDEVIRRFKDALVVMEMAARYAERIEWLTSGDDDYSSFCVRCDETIKDKGEMK